MDKEIWISFLNNNYSISNLGNVRSEERFVRTSAPYLKKRKGMKHFDNGHGYRYFTAMANNVRKNYYIHILVAKSFIANPFNKPEVNHKDGNKCNNHYNNLEWVTSSENMQHAYDFGLQPKGSEKSSAIKIIDTKSFKIFGTIREAAFANSIKYGLLKDALRHRRSGLYNRNKFYKNLTELSYFIETNPEWAIKNGYSLLRLNKNND